MRTSKQLVSTIQQELGIDDSFTRIEVPASKMMELWAKGLLGPFLDSAQNDSPSVKEFLDFFDDKKIDIKKFSFECYVVETSGEDTRISLEGISGSDLNQYELQQVINQFNGADEFDVKLKQKTFRGWWD